MGRGRVRRFFQKQFGRRAARMEALRVEMQAKIEGKLVNLNYEKNGDGIVSFLFSFRIGE